jgi:hypothetical protein
MTAANLWSDVSSIATTIQEMAMFHVRESYTLQNYVTTFGDMRGMNIRTGYEYNQAAAVVVAESDDLTSSAFTPSAGQSLTPYEIGLQFFVTDSRRDSELPEDIIRDGALELGMAAGDKIQTDLIAEMANLTGGIIGAAGTAITWGYVAAAIAQARYINKSNSVPLNMFIHGYQWAVLARAASIAGAAVGTAAPSYADLITRTGFAAEFMGVPIFQLQATPDTSSNFTGGVFPRSAIALDMRKRPTVEPERDASRRGTEFNMSATYDAGVWRPALGVQMIFDATAPTS